MIHLYFGYLFNLYIKKQYIYIYIYILHKNQLFYNQQWETERPTQKSIINVTPKAKKEVNVIATSSLSYTHAYTHQKTHIGIETGGTPLPQYPNLISLTLTQALLHVHKLKHTDRITQRKKKKMRNPSSSSAGKVTGTGRGGGGGGSSGKSTPCCSKVGLKRGPWTPEEDELLSSYIKKEGEGRWRTLPKRAGLLRCGKSCRLRWMNYLRPSVKRGQIAPDEEDLILRLHRLLGNRYI